jgi:hypothetical protein
MEKNQFEDIVMKDFNVTSSKSGNLIKAKDVKLNGYSKITVEDDENEDVKIYLKKDINDVVKEIKFVCSCGQTKTVILDYND